MAYQINIDVKKNYLLAFVSGIFDEKADKEVLVDVLLECIKNNRSKLLFDLRALKGNMTIYQRYALAAYFTKLSKQHPDTSKIQVAVVGFFVDGDDDCVGFVRIVAGSHNAMAQPEQ